MDTRFLLALLLSGTTQLAVAAQSFTNTLGMSMQPIPAGSYTMGTVDLDEAVFEIPDGDADLIKDESPAHTVTFDAPFFLSATEITQGQWYDLMGTRPGPDEFWNRPDWRSLPVVTVSWNMTQRFIRELNDKEPGKNYRLPTEAEWEYAARAGSEELRPFDLEELDDYAWHLGNSDDVQHPVATRKANAWGLYDMFGNAWEWVADWYGPNSYANHRTLNPIGPSDGQQRVRRGGSYHCKPHMVRPGYRAADKPEQRYTVLGFRVLSETTSQN